MRKEKEGEQDREDKMEKIPGQQVSQLEFEPQTISYVLVLLIFHFLPNS